MSRNHGIPFVIGFALAASTPGVWADSYRDQFRANYERSCMTEATSGPDALIESVARPVCRCMANELTDTESEGILRLFDAQPTAFTEIFQAVSDKCVEMVLTGKYR